MPVEMNLDILSGGGDLGLSLYNRASHQKSCKLLFSTSKLASEKLVFAFFCRS